MKGWALLLFLAGTALPALAGPAAPNAPAAGKVSPAPALPLLDGSSYQWHKSCNTEGLTIYWAKIPGSQVIAFKGEGIVDAPLEKVASVIIDTTRATEWIDSLVSSKVVRPLGPGQFIEYDHVGIPFPFDALMSDRDFVSHVTLDADPARRSLTVSYLPAEDPDAPVLKKYTRGVMTCVFRMEPMSIEDETYVEAEIHCDPKGGVPKWLVNFFQQGWPQTTFDNLRRQARKPNIRVLPVVARLLGDPAPPVTLAKGKAKALAANLR